MAGLDWIYASPAQFIEPGERAGVFRIGGDELLTDADGGSRVTRPLLRGGREVDVLRLLAPGMTTSEIAGALVISPKTADHHIEHICAKIGVNNAAPTRSRWFTVALIDAASVIRWIDVAPRPGQPVRRTARPHG